MTQPAPSMLAQQQSRAADSQLRAGSCKINFPHSRIINDIRNSLNISSEFSFSCCLRSSEKLLVRVIFHKERKEAPTDPRLCDAPAHSFHTQMLLAVAKQHLTLSPLLDLELNTA